MFFILCICIKYDTLNDIIIWKVHGVVTQAFHTNKENKIAGVNFAQFLFCLHFIIRFKNFLIKCNDENLLKSVTFKNGTNISVLFIKSNYL